MKNGGAKHHAKLPCPRILLLLSQVNIQYTLQYTFVVNFIIIFFVTLLHFFFQELIPVILCTAIHHPEAKERDNLLHMLFNLIKRPDEDQRYQEAVSFKDTCKMVLLCQF